MNPARLIAATALIAALGAAPPAAEPTALEQLRAEAETLQPLVKSDLARRFLAATRDLPSIDSERVVYWDRERGLALTPAEADRTSRVELALYDRLSLGETFYYYTVYGTPLAYCRALDLAAGAGLTSVDSKRIVDFGFGGIGQLRLLASLGADVVGIEVLELLRVMYREPRDTGAIPRSAAADIGPSGSLALLYGSYPAERRVREVVGDNVDLFIAKNVLKLGYIHPEREADEARLVHLGVDDGTFVRAVHKILAPGGLFVIYNLYPAQNPPELPYIPHATGACPFERGLVESIGFEVVAFDADDTDAARAMGRALGWGESMSLDTDLFGMYTILRKRAGPSAP